MGTSDFPPVMIFFATEFISELHLRTVSRCFDIMYLHSSDSHHHQSYRPHTGSRAALRSENTFRWEFSFLCEHFVKAIFLDLTADLDVQEWSRNKHNLCYSTQDLLAEKILFKINPQLAR